MIYYVISSDFIEDLPYLRVAYDMIEGNLTPVGYSHLADWKDATLFEDEKAAWNILYSNNPKGENLKILKITVNIEGV